MYCRYCGKAIGEGEAFCGNCGKKQSDASRPKEHQTVYIKSKSKAPWVLLVLFVVVLGILAYFFLPGLLKSDEQQAKEVVETFFDSLKNGYTSGAMECVNPGTKEQYEGALNAGDMILGMFGLPETSGLVNPTLGFINQQYYKDYDFVVRGVTLDKEKKKGSVEVDIYVGGESKGTTPVKVLKYKGKWYLE